MRPGHVAMLALAPAIALAAAGRVSTWSGGGARRGREDPTRLDGHLSLQQEYVGRDAPAADIIQRRDSVTLRCNGGTDYQDVSWWLYRCPGGLGPVERIPVPWDSPHHDVLTRWTPGAVSSSLVIKNLHAEETSGLYRCTVSPHRPGRHPTTHYFIVGRRSALRRCFPGDALPVARDALLETISNFVGFAETGSRDEGTREFVLRIPGRGTRAHDYKIRFSDGADGRTGQRGRFDFIKFGMSDAVPFVRV